MKKWLCSTPLIGLLILCTSIYPVRGDVVQETQVAVFEINSNVPLWTYSSYELGSGSISKDGSYVITTGDNLRLLNRDDGSLIWNYTLKNEIINQAVTSLDGDYLVTGGVSYALGRSSPVVHLFGRDENAPLWSYTTDLYIESVAISSDGSRIVVSTSPTVVGTKGNIYLFGRNDNQPLWVYSGHKFRLEFENYSFWVQSEDGAWSVSISSNGRFIAAASFYCLYLFADNDNIPLWTYIAEEWIDSVAISADGDYLVAKGSTRGWGERVYFFARESSTPIWTYTTEDADIESIAISSSGNYLVAGTDEGRPSINTTDENSVFFFSNNDNIPLWKYDVGGRVDSVAISTNGSHLAAAGWKGVYLFNRQTNEPVWTQKCEQGYLYTVSMSSDGNYLVTYGPSKFSAVFEVTFTFRQPNGSPLANTEIYYGFSSDNVINYLGTTDNEGRITSDNRKFANQTVYFRTPDGKYSGSTYVGPSGGEVVSELTEVSEFSTAWVIGAVVIVAAVVIGALLLVKKRKWRIKTPK